MENANPDVFSRVAERPVVPEEEEDGVRDAIDAREVFGTTGREDLYWQGVSDGTRFSFFRTDLIRCLRDPEHPLSLEELAVVGLAGVEVDDSRSCVSVVFTPTIPHCSMATLIGLSIRVRLLRALPQRFKVSFGVLWTPC